MSNIIENVVKKYQPYNEEEEKDKQFFIDCEKQNQILTRDNEMAHICASAFVVNKDRTKILCTYHIVYDSWTWVGGHIDGEDDALYVAKKELEEETSLKNYRLLSNQPISIESLPVAGHFKRGKYVPAHIHLNITYLFEADETEKIHKKADENKDVKWMTFDELLRLSKEAHMTPVYKKITSKIKSLKI